MGNQCLEPKIREKGSQDFELCIRVETWNKEAHNLFDHSSDKLKKQELLTVSQSAMLVKCQNSLRIVNNWMDFKNLNLKKLDFMVDINRSEKEFRIMDEPLNDQGLSIRNLWKVVSKTGVPLEKGDIFKLGRVRFRLDEIVTQGQDEQILAEETPTLQFHTPCKICYEKSYSPSNPLISPCACTGSIQFIHLDCLREWLQKLSDVKRTQTSLSIPYTAHKCQLCHETIRQQIVFQDQRYTTHYRMTKMAPPYVRLIMLNKDNNEHKGIHLYSFSKKPNAYIGRSSTAGIRVVDDISISRNHAELNYIQGRVYLSDYKSKFGTLKLIKSPITVRDFAMNDSKIVQICNHVLTLEIRAMNREFSVEEMRKSQEQIKRIMSEREKVIIEVNGSVVSSEENSIVQLDIDD